jgi:hypothetical protein
MFSFWTALEFAFGNRQHSEAPGPAEAFLEIVANRTASARLLGHRVGLSDEVARRLERGSREDRVQAFEAIVHEMRAAAMPQEMRSFVVGFAAAAIAPGALEHLALVRPLVPEFPTAVLWYAACSSAATSAIDWGRYTSIGRRIERDVQARPELESRPDCDIAVDELEVAGPVLATRDITRLASAPPQLRVELAPAVWTMVAFGQPLQPSSTQQMDMFVESPRAPVPDTRAAGPDTRLTEALTFLERAQRLMRDVAGGGNEAPRGSRRRKLERERESRIEEYEYERGQVYGIVRSVVLVADKKDPRKVHCTCYVLFPGLSIPDEVSLTEVRFVAPSANDHLICTLQLLGRPTSTPAEPILTGVYSGVADITALREATIQAMRNASPRDTAVFAHIVVRKPVGHSMLALNRSNLRFLETEVDAPIQGWTSILEGR